MRHGIVCSWAVALLCACQPSAGATAPPAKSETPDEVRLNLPARIVAKTNLPMTLRELSKIVGATCENPDTGERCFGGDYDIVLRLSCGRDGLFARVREPGGVLLIDKAPPDDSVRRAMLSKDQIVCIQAIALAGTIPSYYYVIALPDSSRNSPVKSKIGWLVPPPKGGPCRMVSKARFVGDCGAGWADESGFEVLAKKK